jgi:hypothetical protein
MVQVLEQQDYGEELGKALGGGFTSGLQDYTQLLVKNKLSQILQQQTQAAKQKETQAQQEKPFSFLDIQSQLGKVGYDKTLLDDLEPNDYFEIAQKANFYLPEMGRDQAFLTAINEKFNPVAKGSEMPAGLAMLQTPDQQEESEGYWDVIKKQFQAGIPGRQAAILLGEGEEAFQERTRIKQPNWLKNLLGGLSKIASEVVSGYFPAGAYLGGQAGAALGAPAGPFGAGVGAVAGAGAGSLAFPKLIESSLQEYMKFMDRGGKGTFGDFLKSAGKVGEETLQAGAEGALLAPLSMFNVVSKIPGGKQLLNLKGGKAVEKVLNTGAQAGIFTGAVSAAEGKFPTFEDYGQNLGMFLGLDLFQNAGKYGKNIYSSLKKAGVPPQEAAQRIQATAQEKGYDLNNRNDVVRVVKDITAEPSKAGELFKEKVVVTEKPESAGETAQKLAERPIEELLKEQEKKKEKAQRPLTKKETAKREEAGRQAEALQPKIDRVQQDIDFLQSKVERKGSSEQKNLAEIALNSKLKERDALVREQEDLRGIAEKGQKPFREDEVQKQAEERLDRLQRDAADPSTESAKETEKDFKRDQKYIDEALTLDEKSPLPPVNYKDRYVKPLEIYADAYQNAMQKIADALALRIQPKEKSNLKKYSDLLKRNLAINKAKIKRHLDKLATLDRLKKGDAPLIKQALKQLTEDVKSLQKDFVKAKKQYSELDKKAEQAFATKSLKEPMSLKNKTLKNSDSLSESIIQKDLSSKIQEFSQKSEIPESKLKTFVDKAKEEVGNIVKEWNKSPDLAIKKLRQLWRKAPFKYQVIGSALLSELMKELGAPSWVAYLWQPSNYAIRSIGSGLGILARKQLNNMRIDSHVNELMIARQKSVGESIKYMKKLQKELKPAEFKKVIEKYNDLKK